MYPKPAEPEGKTKMCTLNTGFIKCFFDHRASHCTKLLLSPGGWYTAPANWHLSLKMTRSGPGLPIRNLLASYPKRIFMKLNYINGSFSVFNSIPWSTDILNLRSRGFIKRERKREIYEKSANLQKKTETDERRGKFSYQWSIDFWERLDIHNTEAVREVGNLLDFEI